MGGDFREANMLTVLLKGHPLGGSSIASLWVRNAQSHNVHVGWGYTFRLCPAFYRGATTAQKLGGRQQRVWEYY